jgi:TolB-like protein
MLWKSKFVLAFSLLLMLCSLATVFSQVQKKVAVLQFENNADPQYANFVRGLPSMLMTTLARSRDVVLVERLQIEKAFENLALEQAGIVKEESAVKVGEWLGADVIVLGNFAQFGGLFRLDARLIEVKTGKLLVAQSVKGDETKVIDKIDELGIEILKSFIGKETVPAQAMGRLEVRFQLTYAAMTQRPVYYQICKLFVDGEFMGMSPAVRQENQWLTLFSLPLVAGEHEVRIQHGYVEEENDGWAGEFVHQPKIFHVEIKTGATALIKYEFHTGWRKDEYKYHEGLN